MKTQKTKSTSLIILLLIGVAFINNACVIESKTRVQSPKGWFKNSNNPHHPKSTNPGHNKEKDKKGKKKNHQAAAITIVW